MKTVYKMLPLVYFLILLKLFRESDSTPIYSDLTSQYEDSQELNLEAEAKWLLLEKIQAVISLVLRNASSVCPLDMSSERQFKEAARVLSNTLNEIYENGISLEYEQALVYGHELESFEINVSTCLKSNSSIVLNKLLRQTIKRFDVMNFQDDKVDHVRSCIRSFKSRQSRRTNLYRETAPSKAMDLFWQSFLLLYFQCKHYWKPYFNAWKFYDTIYTTIVLPLLKRWRHDVFIQKTSLDFIVKQGLRYHNGKYVTDTEDFEIGNNFNFNTRSITKQTPTILETCNIILFEKHQVSPLPCIGGN